MTELLPQFSDAYPDIAIALDLTSRTVDLVGEQVDVAFWMGPLVDSNLINRRRHELAGLAVATLRGFELLLSPDFDDSRPVANLSARAPAASAGRSASSNS